MKRVSILITLTTLSLLTFTSFLKKPQQQELKKLEWLIGKWERINTKPETAAYEYWEKTPDNSLIGIGFSMKGADTTFVEKLRIEEKKGTLYYVADVSENTVPTYFKFTSLAEYSFVSENPEHDFPKMISYELKEDILTATISDGGNKKMQFLFKRKDK